MRVGDFGAEVGAGFFDGADFSFTAGLGPGFARGGGAGGFATARLAGVGFFAGDFFETGFFEAEDFFDLFNTQLRVMAASRPWGIRWSPGESNPGRASDVSGREPCGPVVRRG